MSPPVGPPQFSLYLPQMRMTFDTMCTRARVADETGFDGISLMDHLAPPGLPGADMHDAMITAAALATVTERVRIAHLVLCNQFRPVAVLAKEVVSLDHLSGGRFDLGIGWGSVEDELRRFDTSPEPAAVRSARLAETLEALELLFTGEEVSYAGDHVRLDRAQQRPTPVHGRIPIMIGGVGPRFTLPLVARFADWWNCPGYGIDRLDELRPLIGSARVSTQHPVGLAPSSAARDEVTASARRRFGGWGGLITGTPDEVAEAFVAELHRGVERFFVAFSDFATEDTLRLFAAEVIPAVRAGAG